MRGIVGMRGALGDAGRGLRVDEAILGARALTPSELFAEVGSALDSRLGLPAGCVASGLADRERMGSTGVGQGVAIPHARIDQLSRACLALVRTASPIDFGGPDGAPASLFVVLLVPKRATEAHLEMLAEIAARMSDPALRASLGAAADAQQAKMIFEQSAP